MFLIPNSPYGLCRRKATQNSNHTCTSSPYGLCRRKATLNLTTHAFRAQELSESRGGRPGPLTANSPYGLCGRKATLNSNHTCIQSSGLICVRIEVAVLVSPSLIVLMISVDVK